MHDIKTLKLTHSQTMNRTYFEPKQINVINNNDDDDDDDDMDDKLNLLPPELCNDIDIDIDIGLNKILDNNDDIINDTTNNCHEWIKATAWRIKQSVQFFLLYLILIILNAFVLIWVS